MFQSIVDKTILFTLGFRDDFSIGQCYEKGQYVKQSIDTAFFFYRCAVRHGNVEACLRLGQLDEARDIDEAAKAYLAGAVRANLAAKTNLLRLAATGNITAEYCAGFLSEHEKDWLEAKKWYEKAATKNHADAMYRLGLIYQSNRHAKTSSAVVLYKNIDLEISWYKKAAMNNSSDAVAALFLLSADQSKASFCFGELYESDLGIPTKNMAKAVEYYHKANGQNDINAPFRLGQLSEIGCEGIAKSVPTAARYYITASVRRHATAIIQAVRLVDQLKDQQLEYELGSCYHQSLNDNVSAIKWYKRSADQGNASATSQLKNIANSAAKFAGDIGKLYEVENKTKDALQQAISFYVIGAQKNDAESIAGLKRLATAGNADAQYAFGYDYYHFNKNMLEAAKWCMKASEQKHVLAQKYLTDTKFTADICLVIAKLYEAGEWISKNIQEAIKFYVRASEQSNKEASFRLAQLYEIGDEGIAKNLQAAARYYLTAAKQNHETALAELERLLKVTKDYQLEYELAEFYFHTLKHNSFALKWYKLSHDHGNHNISDHLISLAQSNTEFAFVVAESFIDDVERMEKSKSPKAESDEIASDNSAVTSLFKVAMSYYVFAVHKNHAEAKKKLEVLAQSGKVEAQYAWGHGYYHFNKNLLEAAKWCMKAAEQKHVLAQKYLCDTTFGIDICLKIAGMYERGEGVAKNMAQAIIFYTKASNLGYQSNAFRLGQLYQVDHDDVKRNPDEACKHLILAVKQGQLAALTMLERIGEEASAKMQIELGNMFRNPPFNDSIKAAHWYRLAADAGSTEAQKLLSQMSKPSGQNKTSTFFKPVVNPTDKSRVLLCGVTGGSDLTVRASKSQQASRLTLVSGKGV